MGFLENLRTITARLLPRRIRRADPADDVRASDIVIRSLHVRESEHPDKLVLLHLTRGELFACNATARRIWRELGSQRTVANISEGLSVEFGVSAAAAGGYVSVLLGQLHAYGLVDVVRPRRRS